jgi:hypothetical protein
VESKIFAVRLRGTFVDQPLGHVHRQVAELLERTVGDGAFNAE